MDDIIALNITALTHLTYAAAPAFVARGAGAIINITSVVGISPETLNGVYGASKAYVIALSHSLQHELADKGIRIQAVLPGATATELWDKAGLPLKDLPASPLRWRRMGAFRDRAPRHLEAVRQFRASPQIQDWCTRLG